MENILNWDDVRETSYINAEGRYTFKVIEALVDVNGNVTQTSANGKEFHKYICETKEGERITLSLYLAPNALWKYKAFVKACGLTASGTVTSDELPKSLIGRKFVGEVKRQPDTMNRVTGIMEPSKYFNIEKFYPVEG